MRGRVAVVLACLASGCGFDLAITGGTGDGGTDIDSGSAMGDAGLGCYGTGLVVVCPLAPPPPSYTITVPTPLDTNVGGNCTTVNGTNVTGTCVIIAESIEISSSVRGIGPRPIVFVATKELTITGAIDVASHRDSQGAGVSTSVCANGAGPSGLGGGAGGSLSGQGGIGGNNNGGSAGPALTTPTSLRGGCRGQGGGGPFGIGGDGGHGGGGFYAIAGMSMSIMGKINASGEGGRGATLSVVAGGGGGGGGGSGGMIVLDAPTVVVGGEMFANGGGGGGGSSGVENGGSGDDPASAQEMPDGGVNAAGAGRGGRGSLGAMLDGGAGSDRDVITTGGGGGGGGAGYIKIYGTPTVTGQVSPALAP